MEIDLVNEILFEIRSGRQESEKLGQGSKTQITVNDDRT